MYGQYLVEGRKKDLKSQADVFNASFNLGNDLDNRPIEMPFLGLGVYQTKPGSTTENAVAAALQIGYRLIDTAALYDNEMDVGKAVNTFLKSNGNISRKDVFITTKLWNSSHGYEKAIVAFDKSLQKLGMKYVDLYLIHSPYKGKLLETYDALLELKEKGKIRAVGVSNFGLQHLKALEASGRPLPSVNQIEMQPAIWKERKELLEYCHARNIVITAYGSLMVANAELSILEKDRGSSKAIDECVFQVAEKKNRSVAQILLKWGEQMGFSLIPKSKNPKRIEANAKLHGFRLDAEEMQLLNNLTKISTGYWNPLNAKVNL